MSKFEGLPVIDATEAVTLKIRRADITDAKDRNPEQCVVARAVTRTLGAKAVGVKIGADLAYVNMGDHILRYKISHQTKQMIRAYDASGFYPTGVEAKLLAVPECKKLGRPTPPRPENRSTGNGTKKMARPWLRHAFQDVSE